MLILLISLLPTVQKRKRQWARERRKKRVEGYRQRWREWGRWEHTRAAQRGEFSDGSEGAEGMEEEQQSLAQKTTEREILCVPAAIWWAARPQHSTYMHWWRGEHRRTAHYIKDFLKKGRIFIVKICIIITLTEECCNISEISIVPFSYYIWQL